MVLWNTGSNEYQFHCNCTWNTGIFTLITLYWANLSKLIVRTFPIPNPGSRKKIIFLRVWKSYSQMEIFSFPVCGNAAISCKKIVCLSVIIKVWETPKLLWEKKTSPPKGPLISIATNYTCRGHSSVILKVKIYFSSQMWKS